MEIEILKQLDEWAAYGFFEGEELQWPRNYGLAYRRMYENMKVSVPDDRYLIPCEPFYESRNMETHGKWNPEGMICFVHHSSGLMVSDDFVNIKKQKYPEHAEFIDIFSEDLKKRLGSNEGYTHTNPDIKSVIDKGFVEIISELDQEIAGLESCEEKEEVNLLLALKDYSEGIKTYYEHIKKALIIAIKNSEGERTEKLTILSEEFAACFMKPCESFIQGLLTVNLMWMLDFCDSIGRLDQILGPLFEKDIKSGKLPINFARTLLDEFWYNFERFNGWNIQIGGYTREGSDGYNLLTKELIDCCLRNKMRRPNVAFRITKNTPEEGVFSALKALSQGSGRPALYNDDLYIKMLLESGLNISHQDASEIGFGGCTETMLSGMSNVGSLDGVINFAKAVELSIFDGFDSITKVQVGPHTGKFEEFKSYEEYIAALRQQISFMTIKLVNCLNDGFQRRFLGGDPKLYRTLFTRDCVKNHKSFEQGGARYNWSILSYQGVSNLIDSVVAIKKCIFEDRSINKQELVEALRNNFKGFEKLQMLLEKAPKFGNDNENYDLLGSAEVEYAWKLLRSFETARGGRFLPSVILFTTYDQAGKCVGALPDGRRAFDVLTDSVGASQGKDVTGPTALLNSVLRLPLMLAIGTPVLNLRFQKSLMQSEEGMAKVWMLIRNYFDRGGLQIQISVIDTKDMKNAQKEPWKYADLIVRIGGYSEYFVRLSPELQESVINRTEHI